jgi:hypothetical protein
MRIATCILASAFAAALPVAPAKAADPAKTAACDATVFVGDDDPAGLNVRSGPGSGHAVIAKLHEATWAHVTGSNGAWMRIDRATIDDGEGGDGRAEFSGEGWVYGPLLGVEGAGGDDGSGTIVRAQPSADARKVGIIAPDDGEATVQGCRGEWLELEHRSFANPGSVVRGWARAGDICINPNTVCN